MRERNLSGRRDSHEVPRDADEEEQVGAAEETEASGFPGEHGERAGGEFEHDHGEGGPGGDEDEERDQRVGFADAVMEEDKCGDEIEELKSEKYEKDRHLCLGIR